MPTGYTAELQERPDMPFAEFVWKCARAMGACIMQRDDRNDAPVKMDEEVSDYHVEALATARDELAAFRAKSKVGISLQYQEVVRKGVADDKKCLAEKRAKRASYTRMLTFVYDWTPPTEDHKGLREFMESQLVESIEFDCNEDYYTERPDRPVQSEEEWVCKYEESLAHSVEYHTEKHAKEVEQVRSRNEWKRQLLESVPPPSQEPRHDAE